MKAIGEIQAVGGTHFVDRGSLLSFLTEMVEAPSVEEAMRRRTGQAAPVRRTGPLHISLPEDLRRVTLAGLPSNVEVREGELRITGTGAEQILEGLLLLARVMQNDLESIRVRLDPTPSATQVDKELRAVLEMLRSR